MVKHAPYRSPRLRNPLHPVTHAVTAFPRWKATDKCPASIPSLYVVVNADPMLLVRLQRSHAKSVRVRGLSATHTLEVEAHAPVEARQRAAVIKITAGPLRLEIEV